jgi:hypothetical protein
MKLTAEQQDNISVLVNNEVKYQETYLEMYDHVLSALEARDTIPDLQRAYREVLEEDFGGHGGLMELEYMQNRMLREEMEEKRDLYFAEFFKWPGIFIPVTIAVICYYGIINFKLFAPCLFLATLLTIVLPFVFIALGNMFIQFKKHEGKKSIKNNGARAMALRIFWYYVGICVVGNIVKIIFFYIIKFDRSTMLAINKGFIFIVFLYTFLYAIAAFRAYTEEFKMRITS